MESFVKLFIRILIIIFFLGFMIKNMITIRRIKQPISGTSRKMNLVILISILLGIVAFTNHPDYFLFIKILDLTVIKIMGLVVVSIACVLSISTLITMKDSWRVGIRSDQKTDLITDGFFKYSRNPFFLSFNLLFLGIFLEYPTLIYSILYIAFIIILHLIILDEEKHLLLQHGESYENYKDSVSRYLSTPFKK